MHLAEKESQQTDRSGLLGVCLIVVWMLSGCWLLVFEVLVTWLWIAWVIVCGSSKDYSNQRGKKHYGSHIKNEWAPNWKGWKPQNKRAPTSWLYLLKGQAPWDRHSHPSRSQFWRCPNCFFLGNIESRWKSEYSQNWTKGIWMHLHNPFPQIFSQKCSGWSPRTRKTLELVSWVHAKPSLLDS